MRIISLIQFVIAVAQLVFLNVPNEFFYTNTLGNKRISVVIFLFSIMFAYYNLEFKVVRNAKFITSRLTFLVSFLIPITSITVFVCFGLMYISYPEVNDLKNFYIAMSGFFAFSFLISSSNMSKYTVKVRGEKYYLIRRGESLTLNNCKDISVINKPLKTLKIQFICSDNVITVSVLRPFFRKFKI